MTLPLLFENGLFKIEDEIFPYSPACVTVNVCPAIVRVPVRALPVLLKSTK